MKTKNAARRLMAAALFALCVTPLLPAQTIHTLYATNVLDSPDWVREAQAEGPPGDIRCEGQPLEWAANNTGSAAGLNAFLFDGFTVPPGEQITGLWVDVLARFGTGPGGIRLQVRRDNGQQIGQDHIECFSAGSAGNCRWRFSPGALTFGEDIFADYVQSGIDPSEIPALDLIVNRVISSTCPSNAAPLRVKAFRIVVQTTPCDFGSFCPGQNNAANRPTGLTPSGIASKSSSSLVLSVDDAPPLQFGMLVWSEFAVGPLSSGNGNICLGGPIRTNQIVMCDANGDRAIPVSLTGSVYATLAVGETAHFQFWHRDPAGADPTRRFNYSDGVTAVVCP